MNARSNESVIRACQQDDKAAYEVLVQRHYRGVFAHCLGVLANVHDAEDVAQEAMIKGFLKIKGLRNADRFEAWILQTAKNLCLDFLRRQKRIKAIAASKPTRPGVKTGENENLLQAVRMLPQELRVPLTMFYFDGKNARKIAEKLNISHSGACRRIREARKQLHRLLSKEAHYE